MRDVANHKCYRQAEGGDLNKFTALLAEEKKTNPSKIPYYFSPCKQLRGKFVLVYQPSRKPVWEYFTVTPEGYQFRGKCLTILISFSSGSRRTIRTGHPPEQASAPDTLCRHL